MGKCSLPVVAAAVLTQLEHEELAEMAVEVPVAPGHLVVPQPEPRLPVVVAVEVVTRPQATTRRAQADRVWSCCHSPYRARSLIHRSLMVRRKSWSPTQL